MGTSLAAPATREWGQLHIQPCQCTGRRAGGGALQLVWPVLAKIPCIKSAPSVGPAWQPLCLPKGWAPALPWPACAVQLSAQVCGLGLTTPSPSVPGWGHVLCHVLCVLGAQG